MGRAGWLLVLLLVPALLPGSQAEGPGLAVLRAPTWASREGSPFLVEVEVRGPPGSSFDLRAELGDGERQASRFWNGTGWQTSQRFAPFGVLDGAGVWRGFVQMAANPDSANYDAITGAAEGAARMRVRIGDAASGWARTDVRWFGGEAGPPSGAIAGIQTADTAVELHGGGLAALGLADALGSFRIDAPAGSYVLNGEPVRVEAGRVSWHGPEPPGRLFIGAFAFRAYDSSRDDIVEVCNGAPEPASLAGTTLRDGEGEIALPALIVSPHACVAIVGDAATYRRLARQPAAASWGPGGGATHVDAGFALGADDELELMRFGSVVDSVAWGDGDAPTGWTGAGIRVTDALGRLYRRHGPDSDAAEDWWSPRPYRIGQSGFAPFAAGVANVTTFVAPDSSFETFARLIDRARRTIAIEVYEFTNEPLAARLERALRSGNVSTVRIVVEDAPAGRTPEARDRAATLLARLQAAGADVRVTDGNRYTFHHGKVAVVDERWTMVASENMNAAGFPPARSYGNRGWGVVADDAEFARATLEVLDWDADANWTTPFAFDIFAPDHREPLFGPVAGPYRPRFDARASGPARASLLVSPDHTVPPMALVDAIRAARHEVLLQFLTLAPAWRTERGEEPNPLLEALVDAARRGVRVRVLLAGDFVDPTDDAPDNLDAARELETRTRGLDLMARLADPGQIGTVHNKGLVVDRRVVHVGSLNGNLHSASRNREIGVVLESEAAGAYFGAAFDHDWDAWGVPGGAAGRGAFGLTAPSKPELALVATLFTVGLVLVGRRSRRRG